MQRTKRHAAIGDVSNEAQGHWHATRDERRIASHAAFVACNVHHGSHGIASMRFPSTGGVKLAVRSLAAHLAALLHKPPPTPTEKADGAAERRLFLSFAQMYCTVRDERGAAFAMRTDVHAPARARVNGALAQTPGFAAAYRCNRSSGMAARTQCDLW